MASQLRILHVRPGPRGAGLVGGAGPAADAIAWDRWTPAWEWGDGGIYLDLTGTGRLLGRGTDGPARVCRELARPWLSVAGGAAPSRLAAYLAALLAAGWGERARGAGALLDVTPGRVASFLAPFSVRVLADRHPVGIRLLERRGVRTLGDLQQVPPALLASILGAEGARIAAEAAGRECRPLLSHCPEERAVVGLRLARPLSGTAPRAALLRALALRALLACPEGPGAWSVWTLRAWRGGAEDAATAVPAPASGGALEDWLALLHALWRRLPARRVGLTALRLLAGPRRREPRQLELFAAGAEGTRLADAWRRVEARAPRALRLATERLLSGWGVVWDEAAGRLDRPGSERDPPAAEPH